MSRTYPIVPACLLAVLLAPSGVLAAARNLKTPSIAVPFEGDKADPVAERIQKALAARAGDYTGGYMLNTRSSLHFRGGNATINALLGDLAKIDGATIGVHFTKAPGVTRFFDGEGPPCSCSVEHIGWGDARAIQVTIYLGAEGVDPDGLALPSIRGR